MIIEQANVHDLEEILELQKLAYQSEAERYNDVKLPPLTQTLKEIQSEFEEKIFFKAMHREKIIGSIRANLKNGTCHIGKLIVLPDYQNQGVGTKLVQRVEKHFRDAERLELFTGHLSEASLHLYRKIGYKEFKRKELETHTLVYLEKV